MKTVWRQAEKNLYFPKGIQLVDVPPMVFLTLVGTGDPNTPTFATQIQALYALSYAIRMSLKQAGTEYTVYPLEGVWTTLDGSRDDHLNKAALSYQIMIRQPEAVTEAYFQAALARTLIKKPNPYLDQVRYVHYTEGQALQAIHVGSFDTEGETFAKLQAWLDAHDRTKRTTMDDYQHREIYLSDFRRVAPEKRRTLLRYRLA
ncbi:MAG: GyrI-like domain-containing protein [Lactobacillus sp.]|nr:GyrI-like domain-containing protein [Lactobacillus sp.]MCI2034068.1 GyrI-like domain-containing protein [Lactobacillus sp.]